MQDRTRRDDLLSLRAMGAWALMYHGILLLMLAGASLVLPWRDLVSVAGVAFIAWLAGGQATAWVFDPRQEVRDGKR